MSGFNYINSKTKGLCKCKICNHEWYTVSSVLLSGSSCPKCATNKNKQKYTYSTETFISKAKKIHNSKYDYSKVDYKGEKEKIIIICPEHGEFIQEPNSHLSKTRLS